MKNNVENLQKVINYRKHEKDEIQKLFSFIIPDYILDEIIEQKSSSSHENLYCLLNCAVINGRISRENAKKIREVY